jgi:hypothetical protein
MTYWLLHDVCAVLARETFESHAFGKTIHQQQTVFSKDAKVWVNRGSNQVWSVADGKQLPQYGFYVETPRAKAGVFLIDGQRVGFAKSEKALFVDARPRSNAIRKVKINSDVKEDGLTTERAQELNVEGRLLDFGDLSTDGAFRLVNEGNGTWLLTPLPGSKAFNADISLTYLASAYAKIKKVEMVDPFYAGSKVPDWSLDGATFRIACDGKSFAYRIFIE